MAPEQAGGDVERVDRRADVFGLGSILCEVLTGQPAYTGRSQAEVVGRALRGDTGEALSRLDACGAESELISLAKDCLAVEAEDRPRDAGVVAGRVSAYLTGVEERVRQAELARAQADARAEEERKRRKLALALGAALVALTAVGGGGAAMYLQQREAEASRLAVAMRGAELLRDQARRDPMGDPEKWQAAAVAAERAADLLGPMVDPGSSRRVRTVREEIRQSAEAAGSDAKLVQAATDIRAAETDDPDGSVSDAAYAAAFRRAGLDIDAMGPAVVGARIRARPPGVATALAAALDDWAGERRRARPADEAAWRRPIEAARAADPDATRDRLRGIWSHADLKAQRGPLLDVAKQADPRTWPPASLTLLAGALYRAEERDAAVDLLRRAQVHQPGDVWLNYALARLLELMNPPRVEEAIAYYTAARALRPEIAHELAHLLESRGRNDEAAAVFADLVRLRPAEARHRFCYGRLLKDRGDAAGAAAAMESSLTAQREATRLQPEYAPAHANLGNALRGQGKLAEAVAEFRDAIRLQPDDAMYHVLLADALRGQGKLAEAVAEFRDATRLQPDAAQPHVGLGALLCDVKHDYTGAEAEFRAAIRLRPGQADTHGSLGKALQGQGKLAEAVNEYREALRLRPDLTMALFNLGEALTTQRKTEEAIALYREAIRLRPGVAWPHVHLGAILCDVRHDYAGAAAEFRAAIRLQPDLARAHNNLGIALSRQGKWDEAIAAYREAIRLQPDDAETRTNLGAILCDEKQDYAGAEAEFRAAIRIKPDLARAHHDLGVALRGQGKLEDAVAAFRAAIRIGPEYAEAHTHLGDALFAQGKRVEAEAAFRKAVQLKPDDHYSHDWLGYVLMVGGRNEAAIPEFRRAIELKPDYAKAHLNLVATLNKLGRTNEAIAAQREMIRIKPKDGAEGLVLAETAYQLKRYGAGARLYAGAFASDPGLAEDMTSGNRYNAACTAAQAGSGRGEDRPPPDEVEKARWRKQAVAWLQADLAAWVKRLEGGKPAARSSIARTLAHWKEDADLNAIRDPGALSVLPPDEQVACRKLWSDVDALLEKSRGARP